MRFLLDTNVLISAALFPHGAAARVFETAMFSPVEVVVCDYSLGEVAEVTARKFPDRADDMRAFVEALGLLVVVVPTPQEPLPGNQEGSVRDPDDWPILRAAVAAGAECIVTGDKDLLDAGLKDPRIVTIREFTDILPKA